MKRSVIALALLLVVATGPASAFSVLNRVPAVSGAVTDAAGTPLAGATVTVTFLGTDDKVLSEDVKTYPIETLTATTDQTGAFTLPATTINLPKLKAKFMGAEILVSCPGHAAVKVQAINMRALGGAVGVFLIGMIDAQGDDFNTPFFGSVAHAYKAVKDSRFDRVYGQLFAEPLKLEADGKRTAQKFDTLHQE